MRLALALLLLASCGSVTADPHDAGGSLGGAGGQLAAAGTGGGSAAAGAAGGATGSAPGGQSGAAGAAWPSCPKTTGCGYVVSSTCCEGCQLADGGAFATATCETPAWWSNSSATGYCVAKAADCP